MEAFECGPMKKIVQQKINQDYMPIPHEYLVVGTAVDFDCYVKRFNGYVIVVKAGTEITRELYDKLFKEKQIYIFRADRESYKAYCKTNAPEKPVPSDEPESMDSIRQRCSHFSETLSRLDDEKEKFTSVYATSRSLMRAYYLCEDETLPMECINAYIDVMLELASRQENAFVYLSELMPKTYSLESHLVNVSILAVLIGKALNLGKEELRHLALAGLLHDIGKRNIPREILDKDGPLEEDEFETVREHAQLSVDLLKRNNIADPQITSTVAFHHERLDGSGYPYGLRGAKISQFSQIIGICDIFDALTTERTFRARYSSFDALMLMKRKMTAQLNQQYVDILIRLLHQ